MFCCLLPSLSSLFSKVKEIIKSGAIGDVINVQVRFSVPPRDLDTKSGKEMPWRLQPDIAGGGYFYDLAPHQIDLLQDLFGVITRAHGYPANRAHLYDAEDTVSACFFFEVVFRRAAVGASWDMRVPRKTVLR